MYVQEATTQNWSTRTLERQIGSLYFERLLLSQDLGQMDMYDDAAPGDGDNPTVGILLCGSTDKSVVRYSVLNGSEQLFASKYRLVSPSEE